MQIYQKYHSHTIPFSDGIPMARKGFEHPRLTSKSATKTHSNQTTIPANR